MTAVSIQCAPKPASVQLAFLSCPTFEAVQGVLRLAKRRLGEILSACEFLDSASMDMALRHLPGVSNPLQAPGSGSDAGSHGGGGSGGVADAASADGTGRAAPFYMLIETHGSSEAHDAEKLEGFLEEAMAAGLVGDGTLAGSDAQAAAIWRVREGVTEALARRGAGRGGGRDGAAASAVWRGLRACGC